MECRACGASVAAEARFCAACGERLATPQALAPADPIRASLEAALGRQYEIVRLLGRGGMGAVYLARETALDRLVAIKVLPPGKAESAPLKERFRREARTAAKLTHPNIVPLHTFGEADGTMYYVMGYVRGESLAVRLRREGRPSHDEARRILGEVADALDYAHRQGVVHRDIKPDNVLIEDDSGRAMLTDFGIAKAADSGATLTELGAVLGTPRYMSPEQAGGREVDGRSDLYSLGVMGYEILSGRLPFEGATPRDLLVQHLSKEPEPLGRVAPEAPTDLVSAITRCLAKEPASRWQDGKSLRDALHWTGDEQELPPGHQNLDGAAWRLAVITLVTANLLLAHRLWKDYVGPVGQEGLRLPILVTGLAWVAFALIPPIDAYFRVRRGELTGRAAWQLALRQPRWWPSWCPGTCRRPGDVWDRLPAVLRHTRIASGALLIAIFGHTPPLMILKTSPAWDVLSSQHPAANPLLRSLLLVVPATLLFLLAVHVRLALWLQEKAIDSDTANRLFLEPTGRPLFWRKPEIAALLVPGRGREGPAAGEARSPHELLRQIAKGAQELSGPVRPAGTRAMEVARDLLSRIEALEAELRKAQQEFDSEEVVQIDARLSGLGPESQGEGEERRAMRKLLAQQREIAAQWAARVHARIDERASLARSLDDLAAEIRALSARGAAGGADGAVRLLAACERAQAQTAGTLPAGGSEKLSELESLPTAEMPRRADP